MAKEQLPKSIFTPIKLWIFRLILIVLPILFILVLEGILRLFNFGYDLRLFIPYHENQDLLIANTNVSLRYFSKKDMTGFGTVDSFWKGKRPNTKRIFVLGGSTTAGYPYFFNGGFPTMMKERLVTAYPDCEFEVINLGMTAINSYTVRDFTKECLDYDPDLLLIYAGHNEFYGALGPGSSQGSFFQSIGGRTAILFYLKIKRLRLYQVIHKIINKIQPPPTSKKNKGTETLMSKLAKEQEIPYQSRLYQRTLRDFEANIRDIIQCCQERNVPVLIGTLVSNLRDQRPFVSVSDPSIDKEEFDKKVDKIKIFMRNRNFNIALTHLQELMDNNPFHALIYFFAGRCSEFLGDFEQAKIYYRQARDYDGLRFRASQEMNILIKSLEEEPEVSVSDIAGLIESESSNGLIGNTLMLEHLHPTVEGNFFIAKSFANTLIEKDILGIGKGHIVSDDFYRDRIYLTPLDISIAEYRIQILTSGWPFKTHKRFVTVSDLKPKTPEDSIAIDLLKNRKSYWEAHIWMAEHYKSEENWNNVLKENETLVKAFPNVWKSYKALAEQQIDLGMLEKALGNLITAVEFGGDAYCNKMAGSILVQKQQAENGIPYLEQAVVLSPNDAQARYNLSGAYYMMGQVELAKQELEYIIFNFPDYSRARDFYDQILNTEPVEIN